MFIMPDPGPNQTGVLEKDQDRKDEGSETMSDRKYSKPEAGKPI